MLYAGVSAEVPYILVAETAEKLRDRSTASLLLVGTRESNFAGTGRTGGGDPRRAILCG